MNKENDSYLNKKMSLIKSIDKRPFPDEIQRKAYKEDVLRKIDAYPDVVKTLCNAKDKDGRPLFSDTDVTNILSNTTWLLADQPDLIKQVLSDDKNIEILSMVDGGLRRSLCLLELTGYSLDYCQTGIVYLTPDAREKLKVQKESLDWQSKRGKLSDVYLKEEARELLKLQKQMQYKR